MAGKAEVLLKFDAEDAALIQKLMNVRSELLKTGDHAQEMGEKFGEAGKMMREMGAGMVEEMGLVASAAAVGAGSIKLLIDTFDAYEERVEHRAEKFIDAQQKFSDSMANSGGQAQMNDVRSLIAQQARAPINGQLFSQQQIMDQFAEVNNAVPAGTPVKDVWEGTQVALKAQTAGINGAGVGENFAKLKHMGVGDTENAAVGLSVYGKGLDFWTALERSKDKDQMIRIIEAAGQVDEGKKGIQGMLQAANGDPARLQHFIDNPNSAPQEYRLIAANIGRGMKERGPVSLDQMVKDYKSDPFNQVLLKNKAALGAAQQVDASTGAEDATDVQIGDYRTQIFTQNHPWASSVADATSWIGGHKLERHLRGQEELNKFGEFSAQHGRAPDTDEQLKILQNIWAEMQHANDHLSAMRNDNPTLKRDVPGQH